jgi:ribonuclease M5
MDKLKISRAVIVEGKYDKIKLENIVDALIITTEGFGIFKDADKKNYIKKLAEERGLLIITDSDSAGFIIRNHLKSFIDDKYIFNAYIPSIKGKEKRKVNPSKEGTLGVEGISREEIIKAIEKSGALNLENKENKERKVYTTADLFALGLSGKPDSKVKREKLLKLLGLPKHVNTNSLIKYMNTADEKLIENSLESLDG